MNNLMEQTKEKVGKRADLFYFTTFEDLKKGNLLTNYIWHQADEMKPVPLIH